MAAVTEVGTRSEPRDRTELWQAVQGLIDEGKIGQPTEWPIYVRAPRTPGQAAGWHWTPAETGRRELLGTNVFLAIAQIHLYAHGRTPAA